MLPSSFLFSTQCFLSNLLHFPGLSTCTIALCIWHPFSLHIINSFILKFQHAEIKFLTWCLVFLSISGSCRSTISDVTDLDVSKSGRESKGKLQKTFCLLWFQKCHTCSGLLPITTQRYYCVAATGTDLEVFIFLPFKVLSIFILKFMYVRDTLSLRVCSHLTTMMCLLHEFSVVMCKQWHW